MKKMLTLLALSLAFVTTTYAQKNVQIEEEPIKWSTKSHDFGPIKMGPAAEVTFKFKNNTNAPVVITDAHPSCGCTTPTWTKTPIMPGDSGEVKASYGTENRPGYFSKSVKVTFDNGITTDLVISGTVSTEPEAPKAPELKK